MSESLRDHGLRIGDLDAGPRNAITDVPGVLVGHATIRRDEPAVARTGVTAILPKAVAELLEHPVPAGTAVLNGAGELTGSIQIREWGILETPVYLTSTHAVGRVMDAAVEIAVEADETVGTDDVVIPVVGECDDSWLSDARIVHVEAADVKRGRGDEPAPTSSRAPSEPEPGCPASATRAASARRAASCPSSTPRSECSR